MKVKVCPKCKGTKGYIDIFLFNEWIPCPRCNGKGKIIIGRNAIKMRYLEGR